MSRRTYISQARKAQASQTRIRILETARRLFHENGYELVTIDNLAKEANVSAPTIYALFQSKLGIVRALMDEALPEEKRIALVSEVIQEKSASGRFLLAAKIARQMYDAERAQLDLIRGASVLSPELRKLETEREKRRYLRQEETMIETAEIGKLNKSLTFSQARDILWALTGRDFYRMLVIEQSWSSDEYELWLGNILIKTLLSEH